MFEKQCHDYCQQHEMSSRTFQRLLQKPVWKTLSQSVGKGGTGDIIIKAVTPEMWGEGQGNFNLSLRAPAAEPGDAGVPLGKSEPYGGGEDVEWLSTDAPEVPVGDADTCGHFGKDVSSGETPISLKT